MLAVEPNPFHTATPTLDAFFITHDSKEIVSIIIPSKTFIDGFGSFDLMRLLGGLLIGSRYP